MDLVGLGFAPPALLALGFALVAVLADGLAPDAFAPRGFDAALVPVLRVARPVLAGAVLRLLDSVPAERVAADLPLAVVAWALTGFTALPARPFLAVVASLAVSGGFRAAALPFAVFPFVEGLLERDVALLDVFLRGLLVVAKAFRLKGGSRMCYPFLCNQ